MIPVEIKNLSVGEGTPKICIPVVGRDIKDIILQAEEIITKPVDILEWRVDFFEDVFELEEVLAAAHVLRSTIGELPVLFTFRSKREGGEREITEEYYMELNKTVLNSGFIDLIDVEMFMGQELKDNIEDISDELYNVSDLVQEIVNAAHLAGVKVVMSNHDFNKTPKCNELVKRLRSMKEAKADIPKIAVMPNSKKDVLELMLAVSEVIENYIECPVIAMAMSALGAVSRITGEFFGSAVTFGCAKTASAPGQIEADILKETLEAVHKSINNV